MRIAAVGDNCIDYYENDGSAHPGGNPVNVAVYMGRLGNQVSYVGAVGEDGFGDLMISSLQDKGVDVSHVKRLSGNTAITRVRIIEGDRVFQSYDEGVMSGFTLTDEDMRFILDHDMFVSGFWGKTTPYLEEIRSRNVPVAFDFATKLSDPSVDQFSRFVDYPFFSYDNGRDEFIENYMKKIAGYGARVVTVTMGKKGSLCYDQTGFHQFGLIPCNVVDTMGAGDSYIAGFLTGILQDLPIDECMYLGARSAAETIQYPGAW